MVGGAFSFGVVMIGDELQTYSTAKLRAAFESPTKLNGGFKPRSW